MPKFGYEEYLLNRKESGPIKIDGRLNPRDEDRTEGKRFM